MKRRIVSIFLVLMLISSLAITTYATEIALIEDGNCVYDEANLLTASEEDEIAEVLEDVSAAYETQLVIVTVPELDSSIDYFAEGLYDTPPICPTVTTPKPSSPLPRSANTIWTALPRILRRPLIPTTAIGSVPNSPSVQRFCPPWWWAS